MDDSVKQYGVIVADPPWRYGNSGCRGAAENHYPTMAASEIQSLPVSGIAKPDSILFLWATWPLMPEALAVVEAWGFTYVSGFPWIKIVGDPTGNLFGSIEYKPRYGVGFWVRGCSELVLICRRGNVSPPEGGHIGLLSENFRHSRKPSSLYALAEQFHGPYLELFARKARSGWDAFGNEVDGFSIQDELKSGRERA